MDKFQYMVIIVGAIFCILLLIGFGILVKLTFKEEKIAKKIAPCPDYWEENKDVTVVDVNPNKDLIYKNGDSFVIYQRNNGKYGPSPINGADANFVKNENIGNNSIQEIPIMIDQNTPLIRINNEVTKKITACKVPASGAINVGTIYGGSGIQLRNYNYGSKYNNLRNNYVTPSIISKTGTAKNIKYIDNGKYYQYDDSDKITGDNTPNTIATPGFYWKADCSENDPMCLSGQDDKNVKVWGVNYSNPPDPTKAYTPSEFYIDFKDNSWHAYNMHKSTKCNLKSWANTNGIVWDGITNIDC